ncbi:hypothetical protein EZV62_025897 [Acer yangbiense]|uniref:Pentatricopeptide repeat-containing protein n=1 Tax=Acer yangbiense TaxID=1000413 RepID=A0A5C7H0M5_9ROSI|nr:hypothetical protein EZV62_025897 [Acer yangbiense]
MGLLSAAAPDSFIFAFLLKAAANYWSLMTGRQLHCQALLHGLDGHLFVGTWDDFDKGDGDGEEGVSEMEVKDDVPWISMITALTQNRCFDEVFGVFMDLRQLGMRPNEVNLTGVLSSCAQAGAFEFGRIVHGFVEKSGFSWIISNWQCTGMEERQYNFCMKEESGIKSDRITFVPVLYACSQAGLIEQGHECFSKMKSVYNIEPSIDH